MIQIAKPIFRPGKIVSTPAAIAALNESGQTPFDFLSRHLAGDWGIVDDEDKQANDDALIHGERLLSAYLTSKGVKIWVITEADRTSTCLLLPDEY